MRNVIGYGKIRRDGNKVVLKINGRIGFEGSLNDMILNGRPECKVIVMVKEDSLPKTNPQLAYYFGVVLPYVELGFKALGWSLSKERTDFELRIRFLSENLVNTETGEIKTYPGSLSSASKEDVSEFLDRVIEFAQTELGVEIPPASTQTKTHAI